MAPIDAATDIISGYSEAPQDIPIPPGDQKYAAELRKFFRLVVRDIFLVMGEYAEETLNKEYLKEVILAVERDERFIIAMVKDTLRQIVARDFADLPRLPVVFSDHEIADMVRDEAGLLRAVFRKIQRIENEEVAE